MHGRPDLDGIGADVIAEVAGVHVSTARRWKRGEAIPATAARLLRIVLHGELGAISATWAGWQLASGALIGPDGLRFAPGEVLALPFFRQQIAGLQARQRVAVQADWIDRRYNAPDETHAPCKARA